MICHTLSDRNEEPVSLLEKYIRYTRRDLPIGLRSVGGVLQGALMGGSPNRVTLRRWYIRMYFSKEKTGLPDALPAELRSLCGFLMPISPR